MLSFGASTGTGAPAAPSMSSAMAATLPPISTAAYNEIGRGDLLK